jgi:hypothetical protein
MAAQPFWGTHDQIEWKRMVCAAPNPDGLIDFIRCGHHDENIDVAICMRFSVGMRAEEDDLLRMKAIGDLPGKPTNYGASDVFAEIDSGQRRRAVLSSVSSH